jgi:hypothetical protein
MIHSMRRLICTRVPEEAQELRQQLSEPEVRRLLGLSLCLAAYRAKSGLFAQRRCWSVVKEFLLNVYRYLIQPIFGSVCPSLVMEHLCLKVLHPAFSG